MATSVFLIKKLLYEVVYNNNIQGDLSRLQCRVQGLDISVVVLARFSCFHVKKIIILHIRF